METWTLRRYNYPDLQRCLQRVYGDACDETRDAARNCAAGALTRRAFMGVTGSYLNDKNLREQERAGFGEKKAKKRACSTTT
jgi:hypothetical protein